MSEIPSSDTTIQLCVGGGCLTFWKADLVFIVSMHDRPIWAQKNNRTARETLLQPKYRHLATACDLVDIDQDKPLGDYLLELKDSGNSLYLKFLNRYGDLQFTKFVVSDISLTKSSGLYAFFAGEELVYIGRCLDSFSKRVSQGYGTIHPKNCYLDGQSTNCRLNALVSKHCDEIVLYLCPLDDAAQIVRLELDLIRAYKPKWNLRS